MKFLRIAIASLITTASALIGTPAAHIQADNAPMYETPTGITPGLQNTTVRMVNEQVDVQVREQGSEAIAYVNATFDMLNDGSTTQILTGFPGYEGFNSDNADLPLGVFAFTPANISDFKAWSDSGSYTVNEQSVQMKNADPTTPTATWFTWNMTYPQGKLLPVHVSYQQKLGAQQVYGDGNVSEFVNVVYVLTTGSLWDGPIDEAQITFEAPDGGGFVGPSGASSAADDRIVWDMKNFKPTSDVGATYIFATPWKEVQASEAAAKAANAGPADFLRAAQDLSQLLGAQAQVALLPKPLVARYEAEMEQWAANANVLSTADSWKAQGDADLFASRAIGHNGAVGCWPATAADDYQQAADLGSDAAADELAYLHSGGPYAGPDGDTRPACGS
jgi:hypothetical protein